MGDGEGYRAALRSRWAFWGLVLGAEPKQPDSYRVQQSEL